MAYFNICPNCGCNLDPGERCDCENEKIKKEQIIQSMLKAREVGQITFFNMKDQEGGVKFEK